jgi:hypothetical protein
MEIETASSVSPQLSAKLSILPGVSEVIQKDKILKVTMSGDEPSLTGQLIYTCNPGDKHQENLAERTKSGRNILEFDWEWLKRLEASKR